MLRPLRWLPLLVLPACLDAGVRGGECNNNHVCEPHEGYTYCPQDCYWVKDDPPVLTQALESVREQLGDGADDNAIRNALAERHPNGLPGIPLGKDATDFVERIGNGVCELHESMHATEDCAKTCRDGGDTPDEKCLADNNTFQDCTSIVNGCGDGFCDDAGDQPGCLGLPKEAHLDSFCACDCSPMGDSPVNVFTVYTCGTVDHTDCEPHENRYTCAIDCVKYDGDGTTVLYAIGDGRCQDDRSENEHNSRDCRGITPYICPPPSTCGDGILHQPDEECDDGNQDDTDACTSQCKNATCGDGFIQAGVEECDDANTVNGDGCDESCKAENPTACGNGITEDAEECDDGDPDDTDACTSECKDAICGDGLVWAGMEECDDANQVDTDDCSNMCKAPVCGDSIVAGPEACDDGNTDDTDACTNLCQPATCGDGFIQAGVEECDDANQTDFDGCSKTCADEFIMFVTKDPVPPNFNGNEGVKSADKICADAAAAAMDGPLWGTYVAWLSSPGDNAKGDLPSGKSLIRRDGMPIIADAAKLPDLAPSLANPINLDQNSGPVTGYAWTGTSPEGISSVVDCNEWADTSNKYGATIGALIAKDKQWTAATPPMADSAQVYCNATNHLYCFRKLDP